MWVQNPKHPHKNFACPIVPVTPHLGKGRAETRGSPGFVGHKTSHEKRSFWFSERLCL